MSADSSFAPLPQTEIAVVFDFDITLSPQYMQTPIFKKFHIDPNDFWAECEKLTKQGYDAEHAYLRHLTNLIKNGNIPKLSNVVLQSLGTNLDFYNGFPEILCDLKKVGEDSQFRVGELKPSVKFYVISSGLQEMIRGSKVAQYLEKFWGCTLDEDTKGNIVFPKETISHTTKTQKLFLINKGLLREGDQERVNDYFPPDRRPVPFEHMVYLGDGPSDVPCFSLVRHNGGKAIAVYRPEDQHAFDRCYQLVVEANRADLMCPADYRKGSHLYLALVHMVTDVAKGIYNQLNDAAQRGIIPAPRHSSASIPPRNGEVEEA